MSVRCGSAEVDRADGRRSAGVVPVFVEPPGRPVCVTDERAGQVIDYLTRIGSAAGLAVHAWQRRSDDLWVCA